MKRKIIIIGGGASGLVAAICGARQGADVTIVEHMDRVGKKILSTGNGRCNMTNLDMRPECYRCGQPEFPLKVLEGFPVEATLDFFRELGIETRSRGGYIYPNSDQASAVLDVLRREVERLGVVVLTGCEAKGISPSPAGSSGQTERRPEAGGRENGGDNPQPGRSGYVVATGQGDLRADAVILAAGSKAAPSTGSDGSGYELARGLGHKVIKPLPALVQLRCQGRHYKQLAGIRTEARLSLYADGALLAEDTGELQLTDYGLSGIPTFQISRFAARALDAGKRVTVQVDFLPAWPQEQAFERLRERARRLGYKTAEELFVGLLNRKLAAVLLQAAGIEPALPAGGLKNRQLARLLEQLKSYQALVMSVNPFANAQVCCGGVDTRQVDPATMESRCAPGLYLAGEILDVDGICGGYNLQFAWSSGAIAGTNAARGRNPIKRREKTESS
ncbi:MAG: NAD(P)/FAD-dependent oxidoreductase [Enterocloster asparagiformis]|nr:NAD(P)/FAD-dependent oxidoreductase [Enterocloster asparagiformis]